MSGRLYVKQGWVGTEPEHRHAYLPLRALVE